MPSKILQFLFINPQTLEMKIAIILIVKITLIAKILPDFLVLLSPLLILIIIYLLNRILMLLKIILIIIIKKLIKKNKPPQTLIIKHLIKAKLDKALLKLILDITQL
jgi:hypothetical protein